MVSDSSQEHLYADDEVLHQLARINHLQHHKDSVYMIKKYLEPSRHGLHAIPVPGVFVGNHADLHQEGDEDRLPGERKTLLSAKQEAATTLDSTHPHVLTRRRRTPPV